MDNGVLVLANRDNPRQTPQDKMLLENNQLLGGLLIVGRYFLVLVCPIVFYFLYTLL